MPKPRQTITEEIHTHKWVSHALYKEKNCEECSAVFISRSEYGNRMEAWKEYYAKVRDTEGYALFEMMRQEVKKENKNMTMIREIKERARELRESVHPYIQTPKFENPQLQRNLVVGE